MVGRRQDPFGLGTCKSAPHRAVAGLLSLAIGRRDYPRLKEDLAESDPVDLAAVAQSHFVDVALATAFEKCPEYLACIPDDLHIFFCEMQAANIRRNEDLLLQLRGIGEACARASVHVVALKGAAELLHPFSVRPGHRYISDIDLLVAAREIETVAGILQDLGGVGIAESGYPLEGHHHLPPFCGDDWLGQVEVHRRLGSGVTDGLIPASQMLSNARPSAFEGIAVPSIDDRLLHLVAHAQIPSRRHDQSIFSLRDVMDFENLTTPQKGADISAARERFASEGALEVIDGFVALSGCLFGPRPGARTNRKAEHWVQKALRRFGRPRTQRLRTHLSSIGSYIVAFLQDPKRRRKYLKAAQDPAELRRIAKYHLRKDRFIR